MEEKSFREDAEKAEKFSQLRVYPIITTKIFFVNI